MDIYRDGYDNVLDVAQRDPFQHRNINPSSIDTDADKHRSAYVGLRMPRRPRRPHKSRRHHGEKSSSSGAAVQPTSDIVSPTSLTPSELVQNLLQETDESKYHVFCEMDVLYKLGEIYQWREMARWVKYEEDVEEGGMRWSKPHVASLSLHSLFELRNCIINGVLMLEMNATTIQQVCDMLLDNLISQNLLEAELREQVRAALVAQHCFQHQKSRRKMSTQQDGTMFRSLSMKRTFSEIGRSFSMKSKGDLQGSGRMRGNPNSQPNLEGMNGDLVESPSSTRLNEQFMRKIPNGAEAANVMVGELECLQYPIAGFIRLSEARNIGDITEVPIPTRFLFILLGPTGSQSKNLEIGRSMSTTMVDEVFREVAYRARNREDLLAGIDEFLDQVTALPPGEWDPKIRIEPPQSVPSQAPRKVARMEEDEEEEDSHFDPTLQRTGRLFGGLIADVKRKIKWYGSDFKDAMHIQCVASIIFLYLATLTPNVTFGGLLGQATDQYMGTMECILTASIVGVLFALFSGQPLNILGSTGPMLVLEMILYNFCKEQQLDFLPFRAWIGLWTTLLLMIMVAFDMSALVRYITRFTEESFACLIAVIFIAEAFKKLFGILVEAPVNTEPDVVLDYTCTCFPPVNTSILDVNLTAFDGDVYNATRSNESILHYLVGFNFTDMSDYVVDFNISGLAEYMVGFVPFGSNDTVYNQTIDLDNLTTDSVNWHAIPVEICEKLGGLANDWGCDTPHYVADAFFLSVILFFGTYIIASTLTNAKTSAFFPTFVRQTLSDFAVLIAIIVMVASDILIGIPTPKLRVPTSFKPSRPGRSWFINPISDKNPFYLVFAAVIPALLAVILIFMDQQITAVIVNRKENKLKKGSGYHLDLFIVAICIAICSLLGLPWYVAATVSALAHVMSLKKESECTAPGERATFLGVRENRVTALMVGILSGASVLFTGVLQHIPMAVLYGVFLYMGVAALKGMQFIDRILLFLKPAKYQPDYAYLRHVPIKRVHYFTLLQLGCLGILWVIKTVKSVSIVFPIMVLGTCFVRKAMDYIFTQHELKWLDDLMPDAAKKAKEDEKKKLAELRQNEDEDESLLQEKDEYGNSMKMKSLLDPRGPHRGNIRRGSLDTPVNITEEMSKTGIWMQLRRDSKANVIIDAEEGLALHNRSKKRRHDKSNGKEHHSNKENVEENKESNGASNGDPNKTTKFYMGEEDEDPKA